MALFAQQQAGQEVNQWTLNEGFAIDNEQKEDDEVDEGNDEECCYVAEVDGQPAGDGQ